MMRKFLGYILATLFVLFAFPALAALDASHHDIPNYNTSATTKDKCFWCHGILDTNDATPLRTSFGTVGAFCVSRCHSGAGLIGGGTGIEPEAPATNGGAGDTWTRPGADYLAVAFDNSHRRVVAATVNGSAAAPGTAASGFPYVSGTNIECTSCHSVHDSANTPFVWKPLAGAAPTNRLCDTCHTARSTNSGSGDSTPDGNHPVGFNYDEAAALTRSDATASGVPRHGRTISIDWTGNVFDIAVPNLPLSANTDHYLTGGHLGGFATKATSAQQFGCYTCHSAHQPGTQANNLVVVPLLDGAVTFNPLCMGCHGSATTWAANATDNTVGGSGALYGHPYGSGTSYISIASGVATYGVSILLAGNPVFTFQLPLTVVENANTQSGIQFGANGRLLCSSCHDVHLGVANSKAIADLGQAAGANVCNACHNGSEFADVTDLGEASTGEAANAHHRTTTSAISGTSYDPPNDANNLAINTAWFTPVYYNQGSLADGLQCADCHQFNGTAHNW